MSLDTLMDKLATLRRLEVVQGKMGVQNTPKHKIDGSVQAVPCSVQPASASTQLKYMQRQMRVTHTLYFDRNWAPNTRDIWQVDNKYFVVQGWYESLMIGDTWTCDCEESINPGVFID